VSHGDSMRLRDFRYCHSLFLGRDLSDCGQGLQKAAPSLGLSAIGPEQLAQASLRAPFSPRTARAASSSDALRVAGWIGSLTEDNSSRPPNRCIITRAPALRTKKILCSLSQEQLTDAGIDRSLIHTGPQVVVEARLISTLMSLR
jgi:hypothetical protein